MKRGVVQLEPAELDLLQALVSSRPQLHSKFHQLLSRRPRSLQLNSIEIESILDALGPPDPQSPATINLRTKLSRILL